MSLEKLAEALIAAGRAQMPAVRDRDLLGWSVDDLRRALVAHRAACADEVREPTTRTERLREWTAHALQDAVRVCADQIAHPVARTGSLLDGDWPHPGEPCPVCAALHADADAVCPEAVPSP